jgi:hypothetical protein
MAWPIQYNKSYEIRPWFMNNTDIDDFRLFLSVLDILTDFICPCFVYLTNAGHPHLFNVFIKKILFIVSSHVHHKWSLRKTINNFFILISLTLWLKFFPLPSYVLLIQHIILGYIERYRWNKIIWRCYNLLFVFYLDTISFVKIELIH